MMYFFVFIWLSALYFVLTRKFTNISVLLLSCILYSVPVAWVKNEGVWPIVVWILVLAIVVAFKLLERNKSDNLQGDYTHISRFATFSNRVFNLFLIVVFFLVVVLSGGISVFFEGKYGGVPSGSVSIYYFWNSLLVITLASNILSRRFYDPLNYMCIFQVLLIFIGGDRTVPFLYLIMILRFYLDGVSPISVLTGRKLALGITLLVISPFLVISKTIYTLLPSYGFSVDLVYAAFSGDYLSNIMNDFEPVHVHSLLVYATSGGVSYDLFDFIKGMLAFFPGSSFIGIDPHAFSNSLKYTYFHSWGDAAGVGANFWAQAWTVGGLFGVFIFCFVLAWFLQQLDRTFAIASSANSKCLMLVYTSIFAFYIQRNSLEQILSFAGRYLFIFIFMWVFSYLLYAVFPRKRFRTQS